MYQRAGVRASDGGFAVMLDERPVLTLKRTPLVLPSCPLAEAIAEEWQAQEERIRPSSMPLMRLASIALDLVAEHREHLISEIVVYAETDLVCYCAATPPPLKERQDAAWQPLRAWFDRRYDASLRVGSGITPVRQHQATLRAVEAAVRACDDMTLAGLHAATTIAGSVVIGLALAEGEIDVETSWRASTVDETYQSERWGLDAEAAERTDALRRDLSAAARFIVLSRG